MKLTREVKTGLIALLVFIVCIWGYNFLNGKNIFNPMEPYYVEYKNIEGIIESGGIYYRGFKVGSISEITFDSEHPNSFVVKIGLNRDLNIPLHSTVLAKSSNPLASAKDLQLIFSDEKEFHHPGDTLMPAYDPGFMGIIDPLQQNIEKAIAGISQTLTAVNQILDESGQENIKATLASVKGMSQSLEQMLSPRGDLAQSLEHLASITQTLEDKKDGLGNTIDHMANISSSLDSADLGKTISTLDSTLLATHAILGKINNGTGTAGLLINDSTLYRNLAASTASLDSLLVDLKEHPKRYVHFSLFGKSKQ